MTNFSNIFFFAVFNLKTIEHVLLVTQYEIYLAFYNKKWESIIAPKAKS